MKKFIFAILILSPLSSFAGTQFVYCQGGKTYRDAIGALNADLTGPNTIIAAEGADHRIVTIPNNKIKTISGVTFVDAPSSKTAMVDAEILACVTITGK